jgi:hypothetical protein
LTRYSSVSATSTLMRSAIFFARAGSAMLPLSYKMTGYEMTSRGDT